MKIIFATLLSCVLCLSVVEPAEATAINKDTANLYYKNCNANRDPQFTTETQDAFCACTAAQLLDNFTMEDMANVSKQDQTGRDATNKMITDVYAPCIKYPAKQYHYNSCIQNPDTAKLGNPEHICSCSADLVANHLQKNSKSLFTELLSKNPNIIDPMQALYNDPKFKSFVQSNIISCVK